MEQGEGYRTDNFGHYTSIGRYAQFLAEGERLRTPWEGMLAEKVRLFGLENWYIFCVWADGEKAEEMAALKQVAHIDTEYERKWAKIYCHPELMTDPRIDPELVFEHELAHILINPTHRAFFTNEPLEHVQVIHIGRACQMLRGQAAEFRVDPSDIPRTISQAYYLTQLDMENWKLRFWPKCPIRVNGRPVAAWAESLFHENHIGWAVVAARQIDFYYDNSYLGTSQLADDILAALWRVVLNPYGSPSTNNVSEQTLNRIMGVMKRYGWNNGNGH